ncbi:hypothetical protein JAAARDRAFT_448748 [Jaapia argillacea MUCL 33604]|uniref:Potassium transport protein n=1 Tax=Jaapia argillacea MUCL 33604 TaxID=933084 RepID=A0A067Q7C8_9AGAM|nr:hypothetical protein JAAARDRAFT_448748 [Jaapia argillacea MUCL 33604]
MGLFWIDLLSRRRPSTIRGLLHVADGCNQVAAVWPPSFPGKRMRGPQPVSTSSMTWHLGLTRALGLNFYRIHLLFFILSPLVFSFILWGCNGRFPVSYIDSLFLCVSCVTGTGLYTVDLSSLTAWQQAILFVLSLIGTPVTVSWVTVYARRRFFIRNLKYIIDSEMRRTRTRVLSSQVKESVPLRVRVADTLLRRRRGSTVDKKDKNRVSHPGASRITSRDGTGNLDPEMVRRVDTAPRLIGSMDIESQKEHSSPVAPQLWKPSISQKSSFSHPLEPIAEDNDRATNFGAGFPRTTTNRVTLQDAPTPRHHSPMPRRMSTSRVEEYPPRATEENFGGFHGPVYFLRRLIEVFAPGFYRKFKRTVTMPRTSTFSARESVLSSRPAPYISFNAVVDRNSVFRRLTQEDMEELGGVEYRALNALLWIVPLYLFGMLAISFVVIAPYMSLSRWNSNFVPPQQHRDINEVWFSAFIIVSAWANTGISLVDQNMIPFQTAYPMIFFIILCILAGNTAFPIFLRFMIWVMTRCAPQHSRFRETLHFLLDHPRRCFIYLFPSRQTWFLLIVLIILNCTDWFFFLILDIGNPAIDSIPIGTRVVLGLLQACAVRTAGFQSVVLLALAPAVKVLYLVMMYIAIYPVAMSVRYTNVYEEKSLGIYGEELDDVDDDEDTDEDSQSRVSIWGSYLMRHLRRQLSFDMWWLAVALFLLCIIERGNLNDVANASWFNIFQLAFEVVSAYGTVGLSLGIPTANYSFSGALHTLSKLVLIAVMLRGRHRGLPVALDRAVMLPVELRKKEGGNHKDGVEDVGSAEGLDGQSITRQSDELAHQSPTTQR